MARPIEILLRAHVWTVAAVLPLAVRLAPLRSLLRLLTPPAGVAPYRSVPAERVAEIVRRRLGKPRNMKRRACLRKGLTLYHFLRLTGRPAVVQFGVYPRPDASRGMHAHCWVTLDGEAVSAPADGPHAVLWVHGEEPASAPTPSAPE